MRQQIHNCPELGNFKDRFEKGGVDDESHIKRTEIDVKCAEIGSYKAAFEKGKFRTSEEVGNIIIS